MVVDAFEERTLELIRVSETLKTTVSDLICKPLNKELNALNTLESQRKEMQIVKDCLSYSVDKLDKGDVNLRELINLMKDMVFLLDSANVFKQANAEGEKVSFKEDIDLELVEKAKAKAGEQSPEQAPPTTEPIPLYHLLCTFSKKMTLDDAKAQLTEMKRLVDLKAKQEKTKQRINNTSKQATMRIIRDNDPLNLIVYDKFRLKTSGINKWVKVNALASKLKSKSNDILLRNLREKLQWVMTQAKKLGILPPPKQSAFGFLLLKRREKESQRSSRKYF
nr:hypothetical protein [Tanacetum cinerariifolium]